MTIVDPNSFDKEIKDAQANPDISNQGTDADKTAKNTISEGEQNIDYKKKFADSAKGAQELLEQNKEKDRIIAELMAKADAGEDVGEMYPGFEQLDPEAQKQLIAYTDLITKKTKEEIYKDPFISHAKTQYNENKFEKALTGVLTKFPDLAKTKEDFKSKYFNAGNVPDNIESILGDLAKVYLFDKAAEIGAAEEREKLGRIDLERNTGGERTPQLSRSLEDWSRMAQENPAKFASMSKQYNADLNAGKLKE